MWIAHFSETSVVYFFGKVGMKLYPLVPLAHVDYAYCNLGSLCQ